MQFGELLLHELKREIRVTMRNLGISLRQAVASDGHVSLAKNPSVAVAAFRRLGGADPMDLCKEKSGFLDTYAHTFPVERAGQLAPDCAQAARRFR